MKIVTVVGARPQFIKAAPVCAALRSEGHHEILLHTGQHYDANMSDVFFQELGIPQPDVNLGVGSGSHGLQTAKMLQGIEEVLLREQPNWLLVYGDTNSTLAAALAAVKLHIPVAHVEAGLRSFNRRMPEEINRVLTDHASDLLFCPSQASADNLNAEGIKDGVYVVGDVMYDSVLKFSSRAGTGSTILDRLGLESRKYYLATVHRAENTDQQERLDAILRAFSQLDHPVVFPAHPRTRSVLEGKKSRIPLLSGLLANILITEPIGYLDMLMLLKDSAVLLTDSGGMQKEAYWLGVPCVTLRDETEWVETVHAGWNVLAGADEACIIDSAMKMQEQVKSKSKIALYGDGCAAVRISHVLTAS